MAAAAAAAGSSTGKLIEADLGQRGYIVLPSGSGLCAYECCCVTAQGAVHGSCQEGHLVEKDSKGTRCELCLVLVKSSAILTAQLSLIKAVGLGKSVPLDEMVAAAETLELEESATDNETVTQSVMMVAIMTMQQSMQGMEATIKKEGKNVSKRFEVSKGHSEAKKPRRPQVQRHPAVSSQKGMYKALDKFKGIWAGAEPPPSSWRTWERM